MVKAIVTLVLVTSSALAQCTCGSVPYSTTDITDGINKGFAINPTPTTTSGPYPHGFGNREKVKFLPACTGGDLNEYPLKQGIAYTRGPPGADRVVYLNGTKTFCGCMTHTGARPTTRFVQCK